MLLRRQLTPGSVTVESNTRGHRAPRQHPLARLLGGTAPSVAMHYNRPRFASLIPDLHTTQSFIIFPLKKKTRAFPVEPQPPVNLGERARPCLWLSSRQSHINPRRLMIYRRSVLHSSERETHRSGGNQGEDETGWMWRPAAISSDEEGQENIWARANKRPNTRDCEQSFILLSSAAN